MVPLGTEPTLESETVYEGSWIRVRRDRVRMSGGREGTREIVEHPPVVVLVPVDTNSDILMVRQYRKAIERELIELPAGGIEDGESVEEAANRELVEETGYTAKSIERMGTIYPTPGISDETMHLLLMSDLTGDGHPTEPEDELECRAYSLDEAVGMVKRGELMDAKTVAGLLLYHAMRRGNEAGAATSGR
jgi:ADP-ribose pyrophosphatase